MVDYDYEFKKNLMTGGLMHLLQDKKETKKEKT